MSDTRSWILGLRVLQKVSAIVPDSKKFACGSHLLSLLRAAKTVFGGPFPELAASASSSQPSELLYLTDNGSYLCKGRESSNIDAHLNQMVIRRDLSIQIHFLSTS